MSNENRVHAEIRAAVERIAITDLPPQAVEQVARDCVTITLQHFQLQTNVNQQFDQLLRQLGSQLMQK
jgi:hypothetical protein